jgi:hypothetical protein
MVGCRVRESKAGKMVVSSVGLGSVDPGGQVKNMIYHISRDGVISSQAATGGVVAVSPLIPPISAGAKLSVIDGAVSTFRFVPSRSDLGSRLQGCKVARVSDGVVMSRLAAWIKLNRLTNKAQ